MVGEEVGSAYATIAIKIDEAGLNAAKSKLSSSVDGLEGKFKSGLGSGLQSSLSGMTASMGPLGSAIDGVAGSLGMAGLAAGAGVLAIGALGAASVSTAANWESLMASVSKTTGVEGSGLDQLSADLQQIRMETGATAEGIASAVTTAGSIGIPTAELASFTEVAMQMGSAFGMSAEAASEAMGKIGNVVKPAEMSWTEFSTKAGSAVNDLADSMATSEAEILTGMKHLGATMALLKPPADTIPAWTAMVATVQSLGLAGDQAGEAIQDALQYATKDLKGGISGLLGMTKEELQINLRTNAPEVMQEAAAAIAALPLEQQGEALASFGQTGQKAIALLMGDLDPASGKFEKLGDAIDTANKGWEEGASLASAYGKSQETFNASLDRLGASLDVAGQKLGTVFLPMLTEVVDGLNFGVGAAIEFADSISTTVGGITAAFSEAASGGSLADIDDAFLKALGVDTGEKAGEQLAEGVAESEDLAAAPGEALGSPEALDKVAESAKDLAKRVSEEMIAGIQSGMSDLDILAMINSQSDPSKESSLREFEYLGKQIKMAITKGSGQGTYSIYSDDTLMGSGTWDAKHFEQLDPIKAFELATGMPAPEVGTAAYYRLLGDAAAAEKIELQEALKSNTTKLDLFQIVEPQTFLENQASELGSALASAMKDGVIDDEDPDVLGLARKLESWGRIYPGEFGKLAGSTYIQAMIDAIEAGDFKGAMAALGKIAGLEAGEAAGEKAAEAFYGKLADGSGRFFGDFMTEAKNWTDFVLPEGGFAGPTEYYDEYYAAQAGQQIRAMEALQNVADIKASLTISTDAAKEQLQAFYDEQTKDKEKSELEKTLEIDDDQATKDIQTIDTAAKLGVIKPFALDGVDYAMGQIAAIDAAASRPITKMVYVQEVGGGSGIGSGGSQGTWDPFNWLSFANEGYVRSPTLAVIGDRPGGEYVVGADRFEAAAAKMGSRNDTRGGDVNIYVTVQGSVTGEDLIDQIVEQSKKAVAYDMARGKKW